MTNRGLPDWRDGASDSREEFLERVGSYEGAVQWIITAIEGMRSVRPILFEPDGFDELGGRDFCIWAMANNYRSILDHTETNYQSQRSMLLGCAALIRRNDQLPLWARDWLADYLDGKIPALPRRRGAGSHRGLHLTICHLMDNLVKAGWVSTRNDATETPSVCDVMAEALAALDMQPSTYDGVKRIYTNWKKENYDNENVLRRRAKRRSD